MGSMMEMLQSLEAHGKIDMLYLQEPYENMIREEIARQHTGKKPGRDGNQKEKGNRQ
ncbi:hypothetical protein F130042H8_33400 [Enterocloster alcoholdehydrogenati]|jgi:hypothetical protein|uniref:Uncharacterized protein n=2 Tax=Enterocloster TaxID=2719313 RepID=A0ABQ0B1X4_9FIRM